MPQQCKGSAHLSQEEPSPQLSPFPAQRFLDLHVNSSQSFTATVMTKEFPWPMQIHKLIHPLLGKGFLSSRGAGDGTVSLWQLPLAFPKFNHQRLSLQIVPVHQEHGALGRLNICNKTVKWAQVTRQVLAQTYVVFTETFLAHGPSACSTTQCSTGILRPG